MRNTRNLFCSILLAFIFSILFTVDSYGQEDKSTDKYYVANALYNKGLYKMAITEYNTFLEQYPDSPKFLSGKLGLALSYYGLAQFDKAEPIFNELADNVKAPQQQLVHNLLGECLLNAGKPTEAEIAFRWCVEHGKERLYMELPGIEQRHSEAPNISMASVTDLDPLERSYAGLIESLYQQSKWNQVIAFTEELLKIAPKSEFTNRAKLLSALAYYELKQYKSSIACLDPIFSSKDAKYIPQAYLLLADCQYKLGNTQDAKRNYNVVITDFKKSDLSCTAFFRIGTILYKEKSYEKSAQMFSTIIATYPQNPVAEESSLYLGRCYLNLKNYSKAEGIFSKLTGSKTIGCNATMWLARTFSRQNQYDKAADILKNGVDKFTDSPDYPSLVFNYGEILMIQNKYDEATDIFYKALKFFKEGKLAADATRLIAFSLNRKKSFNESLKVCDDFLEKFKTNSHVNDVKFLKAEDLYFLDKYDEAKPIYQKFIPWSNGSKQRYANESAFRLAEIYIKQKDFKQALDNLSIILNTPPADPFFEQLYYMSGYCSFKTKNYEKAILYFKQFMTEHPKDKNMDAVLIYSAISYAELNNNTSAIPLLEKLINSYPNSFYLDQAYMELGKYYYSANDFSKSQKNFEVIADKYKDGKFAPHAKYYLGWVALGNGDYQKAVSRFDSLVKDHPEHALAADAQFQKALILIKQGKYKEAEPELKIFMSNYKTNLDEASFYYAVSVARRGDANESNNLFEKFIKDYPNSRLKGEALYEMAWNARSLNQSDIAKGYYQKYVESEKSDDKQKAIFFELAELEYDTKNYDRSIEILNKLLSGNLDPQLKEKVLYRKGWCFMEQNKPYDAMKVFENLMYEFPNSEFVAIAGYQAGEKRLADKEYEAAYSDFKKASQMSANVNSQAKEQILLRLGETQTLTDRWIDADKTFKDFISNYPDSKFYYRAKMWSGWALENLKRYQEAIEQYSTVVNTKQNNSNSARSQFQIGECFFSMKQYDNAIIAFIKVETNYDFPEWTSKALLETARVLIVQNRNSEANLILKKVADTYKGTDEGSLAVDLLSAREQE